MYYVCLHFCSYCLTKILMPGLDFVLLFCCTYWWQSQMCFGLVVSVGSDTWLRLSLLLSAAWDMIGQKQGCESSQMVTCWERHVAWSTVPASHFPKSEWETRNKEWPHSSWQISLHGDRLTWTGLSTKHVITLFLFTDFVMTFSRLVQWSNMWSTHSHSRTAVFCVLDE